MDLKIINQKQLKRIYINFLVICLLITGGSYILFQSGFRFFEGSDWVNEMTNILLYCMIGIVIVFTYFQMSQRKKLRVLPTIEEKIIFYEKFYRYRLWWHVLACFVSAFLLLLTGRNIFFYIGLFDLLEMLLSYPSQLIIKKEMKEDELIFV